MRHLHIRPLQPRHDRRPQIHTLDHANQPLGNGIAPDDPPKDIHKDGGDLGIGGDEVKGLFDGLWCSAAADIEEVGGLAAVELDDVHCCHCEASAVYEAANVTV